jgi:CRISPR-associated endonuclease/helicase Cas3
MNGMPSFAEFFSALWGVDPFPWQKMLAERVGTGRWPKVLDLPTASGKTACIDVALFALAMQGDESLERRTAPRRIWFVVDRRIVVDEAFDRAQVIAEALSSAKGGGPLRVVADRLRQIAGTERPLAVARLRGGILRDDGWARLPSQPAVITSTVDQIGSRLLFRGYGRSHLTAPIFAGLVAHDSLVLLDEAHCAVPFVQTLCAVERYRTWAEEPLPSPFAVVVMSATPPGELAESERFPGADRDRALDDPRLRRRLEATKQAALVELKARKNDNEDELVVEATRRAREFVIKQGKQRVAVMVNRVATAGEIADALDKAREQDGETVYDVVLLTGRLRPYERDQIVERWKPFLKAREPSPPHKPIVLVTTQCLEVGADFSFDALVTEAASLDALRQRFGRLDRLGTAGTSAAVILVRARDADPEKSAPDPVYGAALAKTWKLLQDKKASDAQTIDFGVEALRELLEDVGDLTPYQAPTNDAPTLLPAHLDLLCQTAPLPHPEPDVQQYLHGIGRGTPEVKVVWRADLLEDETSSWVETVATCRPVSGEMLTAPLWLVRSWLREETGRDSGADVEGAPEHTGHGGGRCRPFLLWRGRRSKFAEKANEIAPGDVLVVPAAYGIDGLARPGGIEGLGRERTDLWERAMKAAGRPAAVRLQRALLAPWLACEPLRKLVDLVEMPSIKRDELQEAIESVLTYAPSSEEDPTGPPPWWLDLLKEACDGRVAPHPAGGVILCARAAGAVSEEPDLFADDDDLTSVAAGDQSLDEHSLLVQQTVEKLASLCLPEHLRQALQSAAWWHDAGKLDERFQVLLHQGDELAALSARQPLAKSTFILATPGERRALRQASGLPEGFRHEMLSVQLARTQMNPGEEPLNDLVLHLVASHHGHARPLAPICEDPDPPRVSGKLGDTALSLSSDERRSWIAHRVDSGLAERFWRLTRRYGWWGLAYLEAILRLGDWYASGRRMHDGAGSKEGPR